MAELLRTAVTAQIEAPGIRVLDPAVQCYVTGAGPDLAPNTMQGDDPCWLWLAPDRKLFVADAPVAPPSEGFVSDMTDGLTVIEISDRRIVAMGTTLDLSAGQCAQTLFGGVKILIYVRGGAYRVHVERQFSAYLLQWLAQAASALT